MNYYIDKSIISLKSLRNNLILFLPSLIYYLITFIFGAIILSIFGTPLIEILSKRSIEAELMNQLKLYFSNYNNLIKTILSVAGFVAVTFFVGASIKAIELGMFKSVVKSGKVSLNINKDISNYYWRIIYLRIILFLIGIAFTAILSVVSILLSPLVGSAIAILIFLALAVLTIAYLRLWFLFVYPVMVLDNKSALSAIHMVHNYLRKNFVHVLFIWLTIFIVGTLFGIILLPISGMIPSLVSYLTKLLTSSFGAVNALIIAGVIALMIRSALNLIVYLWSSLLIFFSYK